VCLTTRDPAPIGRIGVASVVAAARELLADRTAAGVRYVEP